MGKNPAFLFYPADWARDLEVHPLEVEGAWIRICCKLWWSDTPGSISFSLTKWARVMRVGEKKSKTILDYLLNHKICDGDNQNGIYTITSRRMIKDDYIRNIRREAGQKGGNPALKKSDILDKQNLVNPNPTLSVSVSVSGSKDLKGSPMAQPSPMHCDLTVKEQLNDALLKEKQEKIEAYKRKFAVLEQKLRPKYPRLNIIGFLAKNSHNNHDACYLALQRLADSEQIIQSPDTYLEKIVSIESGNFNERESIKNHEINKKLFSNLIEKLQKVKTNENY